MALPSQIEQQRLRALQTLLAERGGPLPALGFRPPIKIPGGGTSGPLNAPSPTLTLYPGGPVQGLAALLGGGNGESGVPVISEITNFLANLIPTIPLGGGRPKRAATLAAAQRLIESGSPALVALGRGIEALAERGVVASSPQFGRAIQPLVARAVGALAAQGYNSQDVKKAIYSVFQRGAPAAEIPPALPPAPRPAGLRPGYRVIRPPAEVATIAPSEAAAVASPYAGEAASVAAAGESAAPAAAMAVPASALPGWLQTAVRYLGLEQAGVAAVRLLRGENLTLPEFGALAGIIVGAYAGDPRFGAEVGLGAGEAVAQLDAIARDYIGHSLDELLGQAARSTLARLRAAITPQPAPAPAPEARQIEVQPQPAPAPAPEARQIEVQPQPAPAPAPEARQIEVQPQPAPAPLPNRLPVQPEPQPLARPCPTCPPPGPQDCPPEVQLLLSQIENCPPEILRQIGDKILNNYSVVQRPGRPPEIVPKVPVCLCCDSAADFNAYVESNGAQGACQQVVGADASIVGRK
jgi:hypothetical protein